MLGSVRDGRTEPFTSCPSFDGGKQKGLCARVAMEAASGREAYKFHSCISAAPPVVRFRHTPPLKATSCMAHGEKTNPTPGHSPRGQRGSLEGYICTAIRTTQVRVQEVYLSRPVCVSVRMLSKRHRAREWHLASYARRTHGTKQMRWRRVVYYA